MNKLLALLIFLAITVPVLAQASEPPPIPVLNHQFQISGPAPEAARANGRNTGFGYVLAIENDVLAVGAPRESNGNTTAHFGAVYIYRNVSNVWTFEQKISNPYIGLDNESSGFGVSVVLDNGRLAVSHAPHGVYFYTNNGTEWVHDGTVFDLDTDRDGYGGNIALHSDVLIVNDGILHIGEVHVYRKVAGTWTYETTIADPAPILFEERFGSALDISDDGSVIAISRPGAYRINNDNPQGTILIYSYNGTEWALETEIIEQGAFGYSLDLSSTLLAVGETGSENVPGQVYVYDRAQSWAETAVFSDDIDSPIGFFGHTVKMISNQALFVAAIPQRVSLEEPLEPGRFFVYDLTTKAEISEIISTGEMDSDNDGFPDSDLFGHALAIDGIGDLMKIAVGAPGGFGAQNSYVFSHNPNPEQLVDSGDFEAGERGLILDAWNTTPGAKLVCGRGVDGTCGVKFKSGVSSKVTQSVDLTQFPLNFGDGLLWQADVKVKGEGAVKAKLKVFYVDGFSTIVPLRIENTGGVYRTVMTAPAIFIASRPLDRIVVSIKHTATGGAAFIDNVSLVRVAGNSAR